MPIWVLPAWSPYHAERVLVRRQGQNGVYGGP